MLACPRFFLLEKMLNNLSISIGHTCLIIKQGKVFRHENYIMILENQLLMIHFKSIIFLGRSSALCYFIDVL
jgi:hypothetical protein